MRESFKSVNAVFYAKRVEDCPQIKCIGDVIRIHRASVKEYQGQKQLHVNVSFNSSWCLFGIEDEVNDNSSDDGEFKPYKFSGKNYSFNA